MKINKILILIISLAFLVCVATAVSACKKKDEDAESVKYRVYEVTFELGNEESFKSVSNADTGKIEKPQNPLRDGYTFVDWYETPDLSKKFDFNSLITADLTLYAQWNKNYNKLHFEGNGSTGGAMVDIEVEADEVIRLPLNSFTRTGYSFKGWSDSSTGSVKNTDGGWYYTGSLSAVTLFASWEANSYKVILDHQGGESDTDSVSATYDSNLPYSDKPLKTGFVFDGYYSEPDGGVKFYDSEMRGVKPYSETHNMTLYAHWFSADVTISFNGNGHESGTTEPMETATNSEIVLPVCGFYKKGYKFSGWSTSKSGSGDLYADGSKYKVPASDGEISLYAVWAPVGYEIVFEADSGGEQKTTEHLYDNEQSLLPNGFSKRGYTFVCWKAFEDGKEIFYKDGQIVKNLCSEDGGKVVLSAVWEPVTVKVVFNKLGGSGGSNFVNATFGSEFPKAVAPSKCGYEFGGYFSERNGRGLEYFDAEMNPVKGSDVSENNAEIYAFWKPKKNVVIFNANGGDGATECIETQTDGIITLPESGFVKTGYIFDCWNTAKDGSGERFIACQNFTTPASDNEINLYAIWTPRTITVIFNGNGNTSGVVNNRYGVSDGALELPQCGFLKTGYAFAGWSLTSEGENLNSENETITLAATDDEVVNIFAVWELVTYKINYNLSGGDNSLYNPLEYTYLSEDINLLNPSRNGYNFIRWTEGAEIASGSTGDKVFTAEWSPIVYTITYELNGGQHTGNPTTYTIETPTIILNEPTKANSEFEGWSEGNCIETGSTGNKKFTAIWAGINFAITYDLDGGQNNADNPGSYTSETPTIVLKDAVKKGYKFLGWSPSGVIPQNSSGDKFFKALWEKEIYSIEYDLGGGINSEYNPAHYTVDDESIFLEDPVKEGYVFDGWQEGMLIEQGSCGDKKFTAMWTPITYHIYVINGVNELSDDIAYTVESGPITIAISKTDGGFKYSIKCDDYSNDRILNKSGYKMVGWYEGEDDSQCVMSVIIPSGSSGNRFITAKWEVEIYTITYILDGGKNGEGNPESFTVNTEEIELAEAEKDGFIFEGWEDENGEIITHINNQILRDVILTAKWSPVTPPDPPEIPDPSVPTDPDESEGNLDDNL
ncbi:MAG: InlB B-repeat-containing protein [Clostridia bacterium]|nr:InlB B-repeat-containing protein [Clostridia bacterium]